MLIRRTVTACFISACISASTGLATVIWVDGTATGANDGSSPTDAFVELRDALTYAAGDLAVTEIRVATGFAYKPDAGTNQARTFAPRSNLAIRGGLRQP